MLTRQSKLFSEASGGTTAISVVDPPPFFQAVDRRSLARTIFTASYRPSRLGMSRLFFRADSIASS
jgi:hypothetical protein